MFIELRSLFNIIKFIETDSLCPKQECITKFRDNIITASHIVMEQHIPYSHHRKAKVIPGWDIEMDIAVQVYVLAWHMAGLWKVAVGCCVKHHEEN